MAEPIAVRVTRYRCPHCARSHSSRGRAVQHVGCCWRNPEAHGCKTCQHFERDADGYEGCGLGVDLTGRPACERCGGFNFVDTGETFHPRFAAAGRVMAQCPDCGGNGGEVKAGPIIHCEKWQLEELNHG